MFDASNFLNTVFTDANDTKITPCPAGEYAAQIEAVEPKSGSIKQGERMGQDWAGLNISYNITDPGVLALLSRDKVTVRDLVMLDLTPAGGLDMGPQRNIQLGRVREATGLNQPGQPFSPVMLIGKSVRVSVRHVPGFKNPADLVAEISGVTKL